MAATRCVILLDQGELRALVGRDSSTGVRVVRCDSAACGDDASIASIIERLGLPRCPVVLAVPRSETILKRFDVPPELASTGEWLGMATLQIERHATPRTGDSVHDALLVRDGTHAHAIAGSTASERIEAVREACSRSRLRLVGAEMVAAGAAVFGGNGHAVVVAPGDRTTEIVLAIDGVPVFARSIDSEIGIGDPELSALDRVSARTAVEVKRTLMGARAAGIDTEPSRIVVLGSDQLTEGISSACELELGLSPSEASVAIDWPSGVSSVERRASAPLAGIIARQARGLDAIDFVSPHRPPDVGAKRRQLALLALLALVALVGGSILAGSIHLSRLQARLDRAEASATESVAQLGQYYARDARLTHAEQWVRAGESWVPPIRSVAQAVQSVPGTALEELRGDARIGITYAPGTNAYPGVWTRETQTTLRVSGEAQDATGTRALRRSFLDEGEFHVLTQGPDAGDGYTFDLVKTLREQDGEVP